MPLVVGIRFKDSGKTYFFDPVDVDTLVPGDGVVVDTVRGPELARVTHAPHTVEEREVVGELKPVLRRAAPADYERLQTLNARQEEILERCIEKIEEHKLPMRLVRAEYSFDGSRLTFFFTAEKRVDFRMLVRDLARTFRARIELRQIGPRDEAKLLGGIGPCGRLLCCATFLPDYARVSIKMAKDQDLPLNPTKISGVCGRLLCCLSYEHEQYLEIKAELPRKGAWVQTPDGPGEVVIVNVVRETVMVELAGSGVHEEFKPSQVQAATRQVANLARARAEEGITPVPPTERKHREPKNHGERRLLRDEVDNPEVLEALALLEEGPDEHHAHDRRPATDDRRPRQQANDPRSRPAPGDERARQPDSGERGRPRSPDAERGRPRQPLVAVRPPQPSHERNETVRSRNDEQRIRSEPHPNEMQGEPAGASRRKVVRAQRPQPPNASARPAGEQPVNDPRASAAEQPSTEQSRAGRRRRKRGNGTG